MGFLVGGSRHIENMPFSLRNTQKKIRYDACTNIGFNIFNFFILFFIITIVSPLLDQRANMTLETRKFGQISFKNKLV